MAASSIRSICFNFPQSPSSPPARTLASPSPLSRPLFRVLFAVLLRGECVPLSLVPPIITYSLYPFPRPRPLRLFSAHLAPRGKVQPGRWFPFRRTPPLPCSKWWKFKNFLR